MNSLTRCLTKKLGEPLSDCFHFWIFEYNEDKDLFITITEATSNTIEYEEVDLVKGCDGYPKYYQYLIPKGDIIENKYEEFLYELEELSEAYIRDSSSNEDYRLTLGDIKALIKNVEAEDYGLKQVLLAYIETLNEEDYKGVSLQINSCVSAFRIVNGEVKILNFLYFYD